MKLVKHSKYKNTGLLFELLSRQVTVDILQEKDSAALPIIKKYFKKGTVLQSELRLYRFLFERRYENVDRANVDISEVLKLYERINKGKAKQEKFELVKEIKDTFDEAAFFSLKVENYKALAALYCLFEIQANKKVLYSPELVLQNRTALLEHITKPKLEKDKETVVEELSKYPEDLRLLTWKILLEKFNKKYSILNAEQKGVLREFIYAGGSNVALKESINKRLLDIRESLEEVIKYYEKVDPIRHIKLKELKANIKVVPADRKTNEQEITTLLYYYELLQEIKNARKKEEEAEK